MSAPDHNRQGVLWTAFLAVLLLAAGLAVGVVIGQRSVGATAPPKLPAAKLPARVAAVVDGASVTEDDGVVTFYFDNASAQLASGAKEALGSVVKGVAAGKKAVVSGFGGTSGDPARGADLTNQRVLAVREALAALGIGDDKIEFRPPQTIPASGTDAQAQRVEVRLE